MHTGDEYLVHPYNGFSNRESGFTHYLTKPRALAGVLLVGMVTGAQGKLIAMNPTDGVAIHFIKDSNARRLDQDFASCPTLNVDRLIS